MKTDDRKTRGGLPTRTAEDWEEAALDTIASGGLGALSIPELARTLGVTKGSFYWHFATLADLVTASVKRWEENDRAALEKIREIGDPAARLPALFAQAMKAERAHSLFLTLSVSPAPEVAAVLQRVSDRRIRLLVESYEGLGLSRQRSRQQALLTYSAYIGGLHLRKSDSQWLRSNDDVKAYLRHATRLLIAKKSP